MPGFAKPALKERHKKADELRRLPDETVADFQAADKIMSDTVPVFPLYQRPTPLVYKSTLLGMVNSAANVGPFWNIQDWHWKS